MVVRGSQKLHPELDFAAARRVFEAAAHGALTGQLITSPYDVFSVEELRDVHGLREGKALPADLFVFGKGESPRREATKDRSRRPGTAIALRDKDVELHDYYRSASKARGTWQASRTTAGYSSAARRAGDRAGKRARLGNSPDLPGARTSLGR